MFENIRNNKGISLIEVILAMAIFATVAATIVSLSVGGFRSLIQGGEQTEAESLAQESVEAIRSIKDGAWNELVFNQSKAEIVSGEWVLSGEGTSETIGKYTRTITFSDICRDGSDDIATCPSTYIDKHSKKVGVTVTWQTTVGKNNTVQKVAYLTNWDSQEWLEDLTADFTDGTFSSTENSTTLGDADGAIILQAL